MAEDALHNRPSPSDSLAEPAPYLEWTENMAIGIPNVDVHHHVLVTFVNDAHRALENPKDQKLLFEVLSNLLEYAKVHFSFEEKLLVDAGYPDATKHAQEHRRFEVQIKRLIADYGAHLPSVGPALCQLLKDWLTEHILVEDKAYAPFVLSKMSR